MAVKGADLESELIDTVCERVRERLPPTRRRRASRSSASTTTGSRPRTWPTATRSTSTAPPSRTGTLPSSAPPGEAKVRVYNPDFEQHGWQSPHTVIEIVTDDMPFIVDSVTMELERHGYGIAPGDPPGDAGPARRRRARSSRCSSRAPRPMTRSRESIIHVEVGREPDRAARRAARHIERVLGEVRAAVEDWQPMRGRAAGADRRARREPAAEHRRRRSVEETKAFLSWLADDHFTFLGYREYDLHRRRRRGAS